jgi:hypothetical protein
VCDYAHACYILANSSSLSSGTDFSCAGIMLVPCGEDHEYHRLVDPQRNISLHASAIHGITAETVLGAQQLADVATEALRHMHRFAVSVEACESPRKIWLLGHNSDAYDMRLMTADLKRSCNRVGVSDDNSQESTEVLTSHPWESRSLEWSKRLAAVGVVGCIDTLRLMRDEKARVKISSRRGPASSDKNDKSGQRAGAAANSNGLGALYSGLGRGPLPNAHRALGDVRGLVELLMSEGPVRTTVFGPHFASGENPENSRESSVACSLASWENYSCSLRRSPG